MSDQPTATLISPLAGANLSSLTPVLKIGFTPGGHSNETFTAYDYRVQRHSDGVSVAASNPQNATGAQQTAKEADVTYGARSGDGALTGATSYDIAVRVQAVTNPTSGFGTLYWSDWSAWVTVTAALVPAIPTNLLPSGLQTTLTPTIGITYHAGSSGHNMQAWKYEVQQSTLTIYQSGSITASASDGGTASQTYGTSNSGSTPTTAPTLGWGTGYSIRAAAQNVDGSWSDWSGWQAFNTESTPLAPSSLSPNGAITSATSVTLSAKHNSPENVNLTNVKIWLQTAAGVAVTGYSPKTIARASLTSYNTTTQVWSHNVTVTLTDNPATNYVWWAESEADSGPGYSPDSTHATFTVSPGPSISITNLSDGGTWLSSTLAIDHSITAANGTTLASRRTKLYASDGSTLLEDSGDIAISGTSDSGVYTFTTKVTNNTSYFVQSSVTDSNGSTVKTSLLSFTTSFTPPPTITGLTASLVGDSTNSDRSQIQTLPGTLVTWNTVDANNLFLYYTVYRQQPGDTTWETLETSSSIDTGSFSDYTTAADTTYDYTVTQTVDDGTGASLEGEMATSVEVTAAFGGAAFLHDTTDPTFYAELPESGRTMQRTGSNSYLTPYNAALPIVHLGAEKARTVKLTAAIPWLPGYTDKAAAIQAMQDRQIDEGSTLVYRDQRGEVMNCVIDQDGFQQSDTTNNMASIQLTLVEIQEPTG